MYICIHVHYIYILSIHTYIRTYIRPYIHTYVRTYVHTYIHTSYVRTYMHITYTCVYIYIYQFETYIMFHMASRVCLASQERVISSVVLGAFQHLLQVSTVPHQSTTIYQSSSHSISLKYHPVVKRGTWTSTSFMGLSIGFHDRTI